MFHQSNLRAYQGDTHSLLGDLIDTTVDSYAKLYSIPIRNLRQSEAAAVMQRRMAYDRAEAHGTIVRNQDALERCEKVSLEVGADAVIPVTGLRYGDAQEVYGGQPISYVAVKAGQPVMIAGDSCK